MKKRGCGMRRQVSSLLIGSALLLVALPAAATHFRGVDAWADIDADGIVTVFVNSRWEKGALTNPTFNAGVNPARFGATSFGCPSPPPDNTSKGPFPTPTGMHVK